MIRYQKSPPLSAITAGRSGLISLSVSSSSTTDSIPSRSQSGLNPISSASPLNADRHLLSRLADVLRLRGDRQLALGEAQPQRRGALRHHAGAADHVQELLARELDLVLERLGEKLLVVRELPVDAARREPRVVDADDDVVVQRAEADLAGAGSDPAQLVERACGDNGVELRRRAA